jgi:hypothetical protein
MAPRAAPVNISFTVDSASEDETLDELNAFPTPDSNTENKAPARKPRGKAAQMARTAVGTKTAAMGKPTTRRASGNNVLGVKKQGAGVTKKTGAKTGRKALVERQHTNGSDTEEVDEFDADVEPVAAVRETKIAKRGRPPKAKRTEDMTGEVVPAPMRKTRKAVEKEPAPEKETKGKTAAKTKASKRAPVAEPEAVTIPETQPEPEADEMDIEESIEVEEIPESMPPPQRPSARRVQQRGTARQTSAGPRRPGSVSDTERDPALRRKVGDLTKKLEAMTVKYDSLKEAASSGKESNFDQLKKRTDQTTKGKRYNQHTF